jgi:YVTN family beta-propeller protein
MNARCLSIITLIFLSILSACKPSPRLGETDLANWVVSAPAYDAYTQINRDSSTVIPNGRLLTPRGQQVTVAPHPYGLVLSPDGNTIVTANSGTNPISISIVRDILSANPAVQQIPPGADTDKGILASVFMGLAISPDNRTVYVAGGQENKIFRFNLATGNAEGFIDCAGTDGDRDYSHGYIGDMVLGRDGRRLYAVDQIGFRMLVIDTQTQRVLHNVPVGRYPFGITLSPDESEAYVANVGMYEYKLIEGIRMDSLERTAPDFPVFAYGSRESAEGIQTDSLSVPGLGDPNAPESFSVWTVDLRPADAPQVRAKIKTGFLVGQMVEDFPAVGGASPNSVVATDQYVFVSNGNNDCISVIDVKKDTVVTNIFLKPEPRLSRLRGVIPFGLALSPDRKRLYVAESGINAVGVIDVPSLKVLGHIPVGWFPAKLAVSRDGKKLIVSNAKGYGSGPNGGSSFAGNPEHSYIGNLMNGTVSVLDIPADNALAEETRQVIANNFRFDPATDERFAARKNNPIPLFAREKDSPIKHIIFISKENRTYDEVFGQVAGGRGDSSMARFGSGVLVRNRAGSQSLPNATVMPNHLELARRYAISDNFYCDSDHSADGHRWLVNTYPNEWVETSVAAAYGGHRQMKPDSKAPGNLALVGSSGATYPEDYNEAGSMWDHLERNGVDFFNFGFGLELAPGLEEQAYKYTGVRHVINYPIPAPIYDKSSKLYATYNMGIPDQFRADMFMKEFNDRWTGEGKTLPSVLTVLLPNDHGAGERPNDGYPFLESYMADNDLALGRMVEFLSRTPYWKNMAIIVTEDDPQGGRDHVDAHRSILMVISPYAKQNYVGHVHYSFGSIFKTMWNTLGLPYLNQYDAGATDLSDLFTGEPDFAPYNALPVDNRLFDPQKALTPLDEKFNWKAVVESPVLDLPADMDRNAREEARQRAGGE